MWENGELQQTTSADAASREVRVVTESAEQSILDATRRKRTLGRKKTRRVEYINRGGAMGSGSNDGGDDIASPGPVGGEPPSTHPRVWWTWWTSVYLKGA